MAGDDEDSWKSTFKASGAFESIECQIAGLGRIDSIQKQYVAHTADAIASLGDISASAAEDSKSALTDGTYPAFFTTDSSMFHVSEALDDLGELTVKNGEMTIHVSLESKKIVNLFPGTADDAQKAGAKLLEPVTDTVKFKDGTTEEVFGFDVPVPALDQEFDLALVGTKGVWYDHKVKVTLVG